MRLIRANLSNSTLDEYSNPISPLFSNEQLMLVIDQSTTSMGITIGDRRGNVIELIKIKRSSKETADDFLMKIRSYIGGLTKNMNLIVYSLEEPVGYGKGRFQSQQVTASTHTKMREVYRLIDCKDSTGNQIKVSSQANFHSINNGEWKKAIIPKEIKKQYKDIKDASVHYASLKYPIIAPMGDDVADSYCMYEYLIKTKYGLDILTPVKSNVNSSHNLVMLAMPWEGINLDNKDYASYANEDGSYSNKQALFYKLYKKEAIKLFLSTLQNKGYDNPFIKYDKDKLLKIVGKNILYKKKFMQDAYLNEAKYFNVEHGTEVTQIKFNPDLSIEENFRCFTGQRGTIYFCIIDGPVLCQVIAQHQLIMNQTDKVILFATNKGV